MQIIHWKRAAARSRCHLLVGALKAMLPGSDSIKVRRQVVAAAAAGKIDRAVYVYTPRLGWLCFSGEPERALNLQRYT